ncbi:MULTISPECIES: PRC-barrel domain-containing protein [unclassified Rhizobium]|uniref:PRC-barrel domain-containing protein n=1 Tax=unclassified Rhizobium TaxID=2613769 RepID=UPI00160994D1|nr:MULTISPECIES: PRC-barrel domain-containing protein [unclassified Rhizobium]MBB3320461.1 sporulation protein YlmC with PRC-barrel domain [Rhizobium sp. BK181]MBB3545593.1 sporulation protein YlmC with PRC-barrel domain [Rhizobium sp. BK399]
MNKLLVTTALTIALVSGSAYAATMAPISMYQQQPTDIQASKFIGMRLYATESAITADTVVKPGAEKDWDDIGEVNEVILSRQGEVKAVVLGVGGFLGIGEKNVAIPMKDIKFVKDGDDANDYFLVVNANKQMLTDAPAYTAPADMSSTSSTTTAPTAQSTDTALVRPEIKRDGYRATDVKDLTTENLSGATVYSAKDENIGEVDKLVLNNDGTVKQVVIDVGGFLGIGEHRIAVGLDQLNIVRNEKGDDVRVYVDSSADKLKAQPEYKGG